MLKKILIVFSLAVPGLLFAQKMKRCVVASSFFSGQGNDLKVRGTAAQPPNTGTVSNPTNSLRQGFQQPIPSSLDCNVPPVTLTFLSTTVSCNESFSFFYTGQMINGLEFLWDFGPTGVPQTSISANPTNVVFLEAGEHPIMLSVKLDGCTSVTETEVSTGSVPLVAEITSQTEISCFGAADGAIALTIIGGTAPYALQWSSGETSTDLVDLAGGTYTYALTDGANCLYEGSVEITEPDSIAIDINYIDESCDNASDGSISAKVTGGVTPHLIQWSTGEVGDSIIGLSEGTYEVVAYDAKGCSSTQSDIELVTLCNEVLNNFVTPNGDGYNDTWILPINSYDRVGMKIYNRYGGLVYENNNYQNDWSGENTAGEPLPVGAYFFALDFERAGEVTVEKGALTLLK